MKVVFFGTSTFGLPSLDLLAQSHHSISLVVTTPDKPQGRHLSVQPSPVKVWAKVHGVETLDASKKSINSLETALRSLDADLFIVISFGVLLPKKILDLPKVAALNLHSSLLPKYRGPAPIHWALLNGDDKTGVTVMRMAETLDTGDILLQEKMPIAPEDNEISLHERLATLGASTLLKSLDLLEKGSTPFKPQDEAQASYARKITKEDGLVRWEAPAETIERQVRALAGWPGTYTFYQKKRIILHKVSVVLGQTTALRGGQILEASPRVGLLVAAGGGVLRIEELQLEGRRPMLATQMLQTDFFKVGDILE